MIINFEKFSTKNKKDILIECAPNKETVYFLQRLSESDINKLLSFDSINENFLNENIFGWIKDKVSDLGGAIKNIATKALTSLSSFVSTIKETIVNFFSAAFDYYTEQIAAPLNKSKNDIEKKILKHIEKNSIDKTTITKEVATIKNVFAFLVKYYTGKIDTKVDDVAKEIANDDSITECILDILKLNPNLWKQINESSDSAKIPFLSKIAHKLAEYPPFSYLHKIQHLIEKFTNNSLNAIVTFANNLGCNCKHTFIVLGAIVGLVGEFFIKNISVVGIVELGKIVTNVLSSALLSAIPPIVVILKIIKYTALGLWVVGFLETMMKGLK
jgi:hypothetical protein